MDTNFIIKNLELKDFDEFNQIIYSDERVGIGAYVDSHLIGICLATTKVIPPSIAWHSRKIAIIDAFCIQTEFRHLKVGSKLFKRIKTSLESKRIQSIELTIWDFNNSAFEFYKKNGMTTRSTTMELKL